MKKHSLLYGLLFAGIWFPIILTAGNYVIINQVMYDTPLNERVTMPPYSNGEFIELYNGSDESVSLQGWHVDGEGATEHFHFPNLSIPSKGYLVVAFRHPGSPDFNMYNFFSLLSGNPDVQLVYQSSVVLANQGETIRLFNANNLTVDELYYDGTSHISKPDRLYAENEDSIPDFRCVSLHRTWVEFDEAGCVVSGTSQWKTDLVSFGSCMLAETDFGEHYLTGAQSLPLGENYFLSVTPLDPTSRISITDGQLSVSNGVRTHATLQYIDDIGRYDETIELGATPDKNDMVTITEYHGKRNVSRKWLPVFIDTDGQRQDLASVRSQALAYYSCDRPFDETQYENSAMKRPVMHMQPEYDNNHSAEQTYNVNDGDDHVRVYTIGSDYALQTDGSYYGAATLFKHTASDEEDVSVTTYTDKLGRKIMQQRADSRTYYVYNDAGHLQYVLPNLPSTKLANGTYSCNNPTIKAIAYCYKYDERGNMIYKRLPGCEPQYMVYDQMGQLVLTQDGNQRPGHQWTMYAYDSIGRNLYTAEKVLTQSHDYYVNLFANRWQVEHYGNNPANVSIAGTGYASTILGKNDLRPLTINYYDNHDYLSKLPTSVRQALRFEQEPGYGLQHDNATGMLTGTRVYNLSEDGYTATAYYYDTKGRVVQSRSTRNAGGYAITSTEYLFDGSIAQQKIIQGEGNDLVREHYRYTYDHMGRAKKVYYTLNNHPEITLSDFSYDNRGRLVQNLLHNKQDTITYAYDIRSMLTNSHNRYFSERLFYADSLPQSVSACYNGNIAASRVTQAGTTLTVAYAYDAHNRLATSKRQTNSGTKNLELFTYDDAGNISRLKRFSGNRMIDDLIYYYGNEGNQLRSITDYGQDANLYSTIEYQGSSTSADTTMYYDANGNLTSDADRGISVIRYNILNLPDTIQFVNGNQIVNHYDAAGRKYKSIVYAVPATTFTPQVVHYTFDTDTVNYVVTEHEGSVEEHYSRDFSTRKVHNSIGYYTGNNFFHYIKDHLGNICAVVNSMTHTAEQSTMYYASGVPMPQSYGRDVQPYLYNGKEFVDDHELNTYDYGFRNYYATIGRFTSIDPLAEQTPWLSPYSYAGNNFINAIDWMGLRGMMSGFTSTYGWMAQNNEGYVVGWGDDNNDFHVYEVDEEWDGTYEGLNGHSFIIGWEIFDNQGNRVHYAIGQKAYYLGSSTTISYTNGTYIVLGRTTLMYGNELVNTDKQIDNNANAILHYYFGGGTPIQNGQSTVNAFMLTPAYQSILTSIGKGLTHGSGSVDMKPYIFHIGRTNYSYHVNGKLIIIGFALNDGFWDPNFWRENKYNALGIDLTDGKGPNLELGGIPFDYIPSVITVWQ